MVDAEGKVVETQNWLEYALKCEYIAKNIADNLFETYENILGKLVTMENQAEKWQV